MLGGGGDGGHGSTGIVTIALIYTKIRYNSKPDQWRVIEFINANIDAFIRSRGVNGAFDVGEFLIISVQALTWERKEKRKELNGCYPFSFETRTFE